MKKTSWLLLFSLSFVVWPMACIKNQPFVPTTPAARSLYLTFTETPSPTGTVTWTQTATSSPTNSPTTTPAGSFTNTMTPTNTYTNTPNASCPANADITANIDGVEYAGNDGSHSLPVGINLDQGGSTTGDVLTFTLGTAKTVNISLCPTDTTTRNMVLYIRSNCSSASGEFFNGGYCAGLPQITNASLAAGTYYVIAAEKTGAAPATAAYAFRITSGSVGTVCTVVPVSTPVAVPTGIYTSCSSVFPLKGGVAFSGQAIVTGSLNDTSLTDDFYSFKPAVSGQVTVTLDCFDNGLNNVDFDVFGASNCPGSGSPTFVGQSATTKPVEQFSFTGTAGTTYYIDAEAFLGYGSYRLTVQTP